VNQLKASVLRTLGALIAGGLVACADTRDAPQAPPVALHIQAPGFGVSGTFLEVNVGTTLNLEALPIAADSTLLGSAVTAAWQSSDTTVATITNKGVFESKCVGAVTVTAVADIGGHTVSGSIPVGVGTTAGKCALP